MPVSQYSVAKLRAMSDKQLLEEIEKTVMPTGMFEDCAALAIEASRRLIRKRVESVSPEMEIRDLLKLP